MIAIESTTVAVFFLMLRRPPRSTTGRSSAAADVYKRQPKRMHMFYTACYDLDNFRSFVFESSFCERFDIQPEALQELKTNDEALLRFAFRWLRFALFAEPTLKVKEEAVERSQP